MHIFVDSDGVIAAFDQHVTALFGAPPPANDDQLWDLVATVPDFWLSMPLMPDAHSLWHFVQPYAPVILTGCPRRNFATAAAQKRQWAQRHFGRTVQVITCLSREKSQHITSPQDILIDDRSSNIRSWQKAGNPAIRYQSADQTIDELTSLLSQ